MAIAADLAAALDPCVLAEQAGLVPDPWQVDVLRSGAPRVLMNCARQVGKSTTTSILAMHTALYHADALVLMLSPSLRQSAELFRKCLDVYRVLARPVAPQAESSLRLELDNGSRIISLPGSEATVRGFSGVDLLCIDEASRVEDSLYTALRPMVAVSGGRLVALSTPFGRRGWWFEAWTGREDWQRVEVPATQCPRISPTFLAEEQAALGPWAYRQEYCCTFSETLDQLFSHDVVMASISPEVTPLFAVPEPEAEPDVAQESA
jgi:Terminase large subunit, T4likevirus-type, N-terminal